MSYVGDIREYKTKLRQRYRSERLKLSPVHKSELDKAVLDRFLRLNQYNKAKTLLTYVSTKMEVDTHMLIETALKEGKNVAVPHCVKGTREMNFYLISSLDELEPGTFGVMEPLENEEKLLQDFSNSICVVPGFCFDNGGYRLGYGKGYYDRFLSRYNGVKVGFSYASGVRNSLVHGRYDCAVDVVVTEKYIRSTLLK